uniref:Mitotic spindle assembly checkpoint protein MAD1 n=1 Tax=Aceria tosichella TaxID=561515 RepID=A0A6G1SMU5_9ACAR
MDQHITKIKTTLDALKNLIDDIESDKQNENDQDFSLELGDLPYRVIHLNKNPYVNIIEQEEVHYEALQKENERLKARLSLIESGNDANVTMRIDEAVNNAHQVELLTQMVADYKSREEKILTSLKKTAFGFREACLLLTGYRVDALKDNIYRLSLEPSNSDERLFFDIKRDGRVVLLENDYSKRFSRHINTYLKNADSYPAFLAAIILESFESSNKAVNATQAIDMSMSMSTTIIPNYR